MKKYIWTMWWQGIDMAPEIVKCCIWSMKKYSNGAEVVIIDSNNYNKYSALPNCILKKVKSGKISITHLSDIIRSKLLYEYGGIWLDSTILVTEPICDEYFQKDIFTITYANRDRGSISNGEWTGFAIGGKKNNLLFKLLYMMFCKYWSNEEELIDYFLIDDFIYLIANNNDIVKNQMQEGNVHCEIFNLDSKLLNCGNPVDFRPFNKLSWKRAINKANGSNYYLVIKNYGGDNLTPINNNYHTSKRICSAYLHFKEDFTPYKVKHFGIKYSIERFLCDLLRTSESEFKYNNYHKFKTYVITYLNKYMIFNNN